VKRVALALLPLLFLVPKNAEAVGLRAGVAGELGPVVVGETWRSSYGGFMTGPTGKIGVDFGLGRWDAAIFFDAALQFFGPFDSARDGGILVWNHVAFELRKRKLLIAIGPGIGFFCAFKTCQGYPSPGPALMGRIGVEVVGTAHNAISLNLDARILFQGPPPPFNGLNLTVVPAFMIGWEHQ
jgi:hypothetical protein